MVDSSPRENEASISSANASVAIVQLKVELNTSGQEAAFSEVKYVSVSIELFETV